MSQHTKHGCDHIFFIGFLGAGKSTLARNVGTMFKLSLIHIYDSNSDDDTNTGIDGSMDDDDN